MAQNNRSEAKQRREDRIAATQQKIRIVGDPYHPEGVMGKWVPKAGHSMAGRRWTIKVESRRNYEVGRVYTLDLIKCHGYILGIPASEEEAAPMKTPPCWTITVPDHLEKMERPDRQGRPRYKHMPSGVVGYLDASLEDIAPVSPAHPIYLVGTKGAYGFLTYDKDFVDLVSEMQLEEDRLPDLTFLRHGGVTMRYIDHRTLKVGRPNPDQPDRWQMDVVVKPEEVLGLSKAIPTPEELEEKYQAAVKGYERYNDEALESYLNNPCTPKEVELLREARNINLAKLRQLRTLILKRIASNQRNIAASMGKAKADLQRIMDATKTGKALKAPPPSAALAATSVVLTPQEKRQRWVDVVRECFQTETLLDVSVEDWGGALFSSGAAYYSDTPETLDEEMAVVADIFEGAEFPREFRWQLFCFIRINRQRYDPEKLSSELASIFNASSDDEDVNPQADTDAKTASLQEIWAKWAAGQVRQPLVPLLVATGLVPDQLATKSDEEIATLLPDIEDRDRTRIIKKLRK